MNFIKLFLPIIFPSWRFFSSIGPSPRIDFALLTSPHAIPSDSDWMEIFSLPETLSLEKWLKHLFYNPRWNERLFINTCAEHLLENDEVFYAHKIEQYIRVQIIPKRKLDELLIHSQQSCFVFRIRTLVREQCNLVTQVAYVSPYYLLQGQEVEV